MQGKDLETIIIWGAIAFGYIFTTHLVLNYPPHTTKDYTAELRVAKENFDWTLLPVLLCVLNFYLEEIRNGRWNVFFAGIGFLTMDIYNEVWNSLLYHFTNKFAAPWLCNLKTTYLVLVGWNIEIILTFLLLGLFATKILPKNKELKIFGINNRHFCAIILSIIAVSVELILNHYGALVWEFKLKKFWNAQCPYLIFLIGYLPFFEICYYIHDLPTFKNQLSFILSFTGIAVSMLFGSIFQGLI